MGPLRATMVLYPAHERGLVIAMPDAEPERRKPKVMDPAEAEKVSQARSFDPEEYAEILKKRREKEEEQARELFGDKEPFPYPDTDTDS